MPILIVAFYISKAGLKGSIVNDFIMFIHIISIIMLITSLHDYVLKHFGMNAIYNGMLDAATNQSNPNYNPDVLKSVFKIRT